MKRLQPLTACLAACTLSLAAQAGTHQRKAPAKAAQAAPEAPVVIPAASAEQLQAMALTLFGSFDCGPKDVLIVTRSVDHEGYVEVKHGKDSFMMKPVRSSTGAVRLEDVTGKMLMVQIPAKSMLMDTKLGQRVADACRNDEQKQVVESANSLGISAPGQVQVSQSETAAPAPVKH